MFINNRSKNQFGRPEGRGSPDPVSISEVKNASVSACIAVCGKSGKLSTLFFYDDDVG